MSDIDANIIDTDKAESRQDSDVSLNKSVKRVVLEVVSFILALSLIMYFICMLLKMTEPVNIASLQGIYKEKDSLDVVVVGASEVYASYCAPLAYEECGYTSYSYGVSGVPGSLYKAMIREVMSTQSPKLVIVELNGLLQKNSYYDRQGNLHAFIDNINSADNRMMAINEAVDDDDRDDYKMINYLNVYHNNWQNIGKCFTVLATRATVALERQSYLKGYATFGKKATNSDINKVKSNYFTKKSQAIFEDLLEYCDTCTDTAFLFVRFPHQNKNTEQDIYDKISDMVAKHGYSFVDFGYVKDEIGIKPIEDYYNDEHLNAKGAKKFTSYLSNYIVSNYDVYSEHTADVVKSWQKSVKKTNAILTRAEADIDNNLGTYYYELSVYLPV